MNNPSLELLSLFMGFLFNANVVAFALCSCLIFSVYLYFQRKYRKLSHQLRIKVSSDLHDEVGSLLTGIAMQAELLEILDDDARKRSIHQIISRSREAMTAMRDIVWSLDARKDNWDSLLDRLREHAGEVLEPRSIAFEVKIEGVDCEKELSTDLRKHLYLIGKEAITNVAKHSSADCVTFCIQKIEHQLTVTIQDNGQVSPQAQQKAAGLGLSNIGMRAKALGARFNIICQNGFGIKLNMTA